MRYIILDTNFILSCIRNKIDFFEKIKLMGYKILIPIQVIKEIKGISESKKKLKFREEADIALKILNKNSFKKIDIKNKNVDKGIINLAKQNNKYIVATLDKEIKDKTSNTKLIIRRNKNLELA